MTNITIPNKRMIAQWILALIMLFIVGFASLSAPFPIQLFFGITGYALVIYFMPSVWLVLLPLLSITVNLSPYTGRILFNELDFFILTTLAIGLTKTRLSVISIPKTSGLAIAIFLIVICWADWQRIISDILAPHFTNPYYTNGYAFKIVKASIYGLFLALLFRQQLCDNKKQTLAAFFMGGVVSAIVIFTIILWEKGVLNTLLNGSSLVQIVSTFLNFSGAYRVTGLLSDMHTGGEAIDGVFILLTPVTLAAFIFFRSPTLKILSMLAAGGLFYSIIVGYTRSTYVAAGIVLGYIIWTGIKLKKQEHASRRIDKSNEQADHLSTAFFISIITMTITGALLYQHIGYYALLPIVMISITPTLLILLKYPKKLFTPTLIFNNATAMVLFIYLHFNSRWFPPSISGCIVILSASFALGISSFMLSQHLPKYRRWTTISLSHSTSIFGALILFVGLGGTEISTRFETVEQDLQMRISHWKNVINSGDWSGAQIFTGQPAGSYPKNYLISYPETVSNVGSFSIASAPEGEILLLGGGDDLKLGQRIHLTPNSGYSLSAEVKASERTKYTVHYCERNLIVQNRYNANCANKSIYIEPSGDWQNMSIEINTKNVGSKNFLMRKPTLFYMENSSVGSILKIKNFSLKPIGKQHEILANNQFKNGFDHWFFYNDFSHLPWHIKNIFLEISYNGGLLGLAAFLAILILAIRHQKQFHHPLLGHTIVAIILGWIALGMFGSPVDSARASWLFWTLIFALALGEKSAEHKK